MVTSSAISSLHDDRGSGWRQLSYFDQRFDAEIVVDRWKSEGGDAGEWGIFALLENSRWTRCFCRRFRREVVIPKCRASLRRRVLTAWSKLDMLLLARLEISEAQEARFESAAAATCWARNGDDPDTRGRIETPALHR